MKRFDENNKLTPAPGAYNDPRNALEALKKITGMKRSPFGQTAVRFHPENKTKLTPGKHKSIALAFQWFKNKVAH